jgi:ABC-2 type transport system permease protein
MKALGKLILVELKLFVREPIALVFTLIMPLIMFIVMGEVFGKAADVSAIYRGVNAMDYYTPAYIGVVIAAVGLIAIPVHLAGYREKGILRRLRASSLSVGNLFLSQLVVGLIITAVCMAVLIIPAVTLYHIAAPHNLALVIGGSVLAMLSFTCMGIMLGFILPSARAAQGVGMPLFFLMYVVSGSAPPREAMSSMMQNIGQALPLWHVTSVVQDAWLGYGWNVAASLILAGATLAAALITFLVFRKE